MFNLGSSYFHVPLSTVRHLLNVVRRLLNGLENQGHIVFVDRFYSAPILFKYLSSHGIHACGTAMTNRRHFPKQIVTTKRQLPRGQHKFLCCSNMTAVAWCDRRPIYFLSTYHDPTTMTSINRKNRDGTISAVSCPQLVVDYNSFMGGVDHNAQMCKLYKPRRHYRWPRRLFIKCIMWACYDAFVIAQQYVPCRRAGHRLYTITNFVEDCVESLIPDQQSTSTVRRRSTW